DSTANFRLPASLPSLPSDFQHDLARAKNSSTAVLFSTSGLGREQPVRQREIARGRQGDRETRRQGDKEKESSERIMPLSIFISPPCLLVSSSPCLSFCLSPCPLVYLSPCLLVPLSPLCGLFFDVGSRLNDVNLIAYCDPFDVLIASAERAFDLQRGAGQSPNDRVGQHATLRVNLDLPHAAALIESQHCVVA